jgi:hypothetical protein
MKVLKHIGKFQLHVPSIGARGRGIVPILSSGGNPNVQPNRKRLSSVQKLHNVSAARQMDCLPRLQITASAAKTMELVLLHLSGAQTTANPAYTINAYITAGKCYKDMYKTTRAHYRKVIAQLHQLERYKPSPPSQHRPPRKQT